MERYKTTINDKESEAIRYDMALQKVRKVRAFYNHLIAYVLFNTIIIITNYPGKPAAEFWTFNTFSIAFFWGIGLASHAASVFGRNIFFSTEWEERKIRQLMEKDKKQDWE